MGYRTTNKARLLEILAEYRMVELSESAMMDFYTAIADAVKLLPDDISDDDARQLGNQITETVNNVVNNFANGIIVQTIVGDLTETVTYVGELGIQQYKAEKVDVSIEQNIQSSFDGLALVGSLKANGDGNEKGNI